MDCSIPGSSVLHHILEFAQIAAHWVGDAIQPSHSLSSPSPPAFSLSQHQSLFKWGSSTHQVAKVLDGVSASASVLLVNIQGWFHLGWIGITSLQSKRLSRVFSKMIVQKHQLFGAQPFYSPTLTSIHDYWKNHSFDLVDLCSQSDVSTLWYIV